MSLPFPAIDRIFFLAFMRQSFHTVIQVFAVRAKCAETANLYVYICKKPTDIQVVIKSGDLSFIWLDQKLTSAQAFVSN